MSPETVKCSLKCKITRHWKPLLLHQIFPALTEPHFFLLIPSTRFHRILYPYILNTNWHNCQITGISLSYVDSRLRISELVYHSAIKQKQNVDHHL